MNAVATQRSYLFVPADRPERIAKAAASGADAVIVDLEDAVAPERKVAARAAARSALSAELEVLVRINGADTDWFRDDVDLCRAPGVAGVVLPKAERVADLDFIAARLGPAMPLLALIETAAGMRHAEVIAGHEGVARLLFGSIDFQLDLGISGEGEELLYFRSQLVLASRLADLPAPVDGVTTALDDPEILRADALRARRLGFGGKLCIHPKQVDIVNAAFAPSAEEIAWAQRIVAAAGEARGAAVAVDGKMVDRPVLARARKILAGTRA